MHLLAVTSYVCFYSVVLRAKYIFNILWYMKYTLFTVAKHSKDAVNNPATLKPNFLLPFCNRNSISFCIGTGVTYHITPYLKLITTGKGE